MIEQSPLNQSLDDDLVGPYRKPLRRDPAWWVSVVAVVVFTAANGARAWRESSSAANAALVAGATAVLSAIGVVFVAAAVVGVPRGWRRGRRGPRRRQPPG